MFSDPSVNSTGTQRFHRTIPIRPASHHPPDLSGFRYHTGSELLRVHADEACPPLFRDLGLEATARFLRGQLVRLCGPSSPITYLRTADYEEPYRDYGGIGRIMILQPKQIGPWHSGLSSIFVSERQTCVDYSIMVLIPSAISPSEAASRFSHLRNREELCEDVGAGWYGEALAETACRLERLIATHQESERQANPLRRLFQSSKQEDRERARNLMDIHRLTESDLCTAWHHLPEDRRAEIRAALQEIGELLK